MRRTFFAALAICIAVLMLALAGTIYVAVPRWGGRRLQQVANRLYSEEGQVTISPAKKVTVKAVKNAKKQKKNANKRQNRKPKR